MTQTETAAVSTAEAVRAFPRYPAYHVSGVPWLGQIPAHWESVPLKRLFYVANGSTPASGVEGYWDGDIVWVTPSDLGRLSGDTISDCDRRISEAGYQSCGTSLVPAGSLVLSTRAPIGHLAIAGVPLCTNQGCRCLVFRRADDQRYFYYLLVAARQELRSLGQGTTFQELGNDKLEGIYLTRPPLAEQRVIAAFLDRESARLDALVAAKRRLIGLLREKRAALISRAVTRGLDASAPLRDSGVPWLGAIPAYWEVKRLKYLTDDERPVMYGIVLPGPHIEGGIPIVKGGDVSPERLRLGVLKRTSPEIESGYVRSRLKAGDIVYAIRGSIGMAEIVPTEIEGANLTQDAARVAPRRGIFGPWLLYALKSSRVFAQLDAGALGATIRGINIRDLKRVVVPVPPVPEQRAIAIHLDAETAKLDALVSAIERQIERLGEYRTALIAAAVTGQIDVREGAARA